MGDSAGQKRLGSLVKTPGMSFTLVVCDAIIQDITQEERADIQFLSAELRELDPRGFCIVRRVGLLVPSV
jgi:hypothetical protein